MLSLESGPLVSFAFPQALQRKSKRLSKKKRNQRPPLQLPLLLMNSILLQRTQLLMLQLPRQ
jgi:hypothetical protein